MDDDNLISPPGDTIRETLEFNRISEYEFALDMNMTIYQVRELLEGSTIITPDVANRLEHALHIDHEFWITRERIYRNKLKRQ